MCVRLVLLKSTAHVPILLILTSAFSYRLNVSWSESNETMWLEAFSKGKMNTRKHNGLSAFTTGSGFKFTLDWKTLRLNLEGGWWCVNACSDCLDETANCQSILHMVLCKIWQFSNKNKIINSIRKGSKFVSFLQKQNILQKIYRIQTCAVNKMTFIVISLPITNHFNAKLNLLISIASLS